jgi:hypothetical protein
MPALFLVGAGRWEFSLGLRRPVKTSFQPASRTFGDFSIRRHMAMRRIIADLHRS